MLVEYIMVWAVLSNVVCGHVVVVVQWAVLSDVGCGHAMLSCRLKDELDRIAVTSELLTGGPCWYSMHSGGWLMPVLRRPCPVISAC